MPKVFKVAMLTLSRRETRECHSYHYAPFMDECHPLVLRETYPGIYWWFTDGMHPNELVRIRRVQGLDITNLWDCRGRRYAEELATLFVHAPKVCDTLADAIDGVDGVFICSGDSDGSLSLPHVAPCLKAGLPTFIDKPFAREYADAQAMVDMARKTGAPLMSASILSLRG